MNKICSLIICCFFTISLSAQTVKEVIEQAKTLNFFEKYQQVVSLLLKNETLIKASDNLEYHWIFNTLMGNAYSKIDPSKAIFYYLEAKTDADTLYGKNSTQYLSNNYNLSFACYLAGNYKDAIKYGLEQIEIVEKKFGKDNLTYAETLHSIAIICGLSKDYSSALKMLIECLDIRRKYITNKNDDNYSDIIKTIKDIANYSSTIHDYKNAEKYYQDLLNETSDIKGKKSIDYAMVLNNLGRVYLSIGNYQKAENLLLESKLIFEENPDINSDRYANLLDNMGLLYFTMQNYKKAILSYKEAVEIYKKVYGSDNLMYKNQLVSTGLIFLKMQNYHDAEECFLEALNYMETHKDKPSENDLAFYGNEVKNLFTSLLYTLYEHLGNLYKETRDFDKAKSYFDILLSVNDPYNRIDKSTIYNSLGQIYFEKRDFILSEKYYTLALKECKNESLFRNISINISNMYLKQGNISKAQKLLVDLVSDIKQKRGINNIDYILSISTLSSLYRDTYQYNLSEELILEAKTLLKELSGESNANYYYAAFCNNLGLLYDNMERYKEAESAYIESIEVTKNVSEEKSLNYARSISNLADFYRKMGNLKKEKDLVEKALSITQELVGENNPEYAVSMRDLARLNDLELKYEDAEKNYKIALNTFINIYGNNDYQVATTLTDLGYHYLTVDSIESAYNCYNQALAVIQNIYGDNKYLYIYNIERVGLLNLLMGNTQNAEKIFKSALDIIDKKKDSPLFSILTDDLILLYLSVGDCPKASQYIKENQLDKKTVYDNFSFLSSHERTLYWDKYRYKILKNYEQIWECPSDDNRGYAYNDILFEKGLLLRYSNKFREAILNTKDSELISKLNNLTDLRRQITALQMDGKSSNHIEELENDANALDKQLTESAGINADQTGLVDWEAIKNKLTNKEAAIEFLSFPNYTLKRTDSIMYCALLVRKDSKAPEFITLFEKKQLAELLSVGNNTIDKRIQKVYTGGNPHLFNGQKLYQLIWQPLEKYLDGIEIIYYSPSGMLNQIAFSAIPVDTVCLTDKYNLHLVSSTREIVNEKQETLLPIKDVVEYGGIQYDIQDTTQLISLTKKYKKPESDMLASRSLPNDSTRSGSWHYLSGTEVEVNDIQKLLQQSKVPNIKFMGAEATEESFKALSGNSPELLHLATHGFFLQDEKQIRETGFMQMMNSENHSYINPLLRSGLLFAGANRAWTNQDVISGIEDGVLTAEEIANMDLSKTKLAVLSACETGLGEVNNSEGVFGLQRAFKLAGVETLVMSLWKVDDTTTSQFMLAFYQNLLAGKSKLESFKIAQKQIREQYKNPYYWAAFVMMD
ncbi:MAG: CHAT domain-containing protein [Candidatus Azobacteroides sp.]|nr:CHAT domain-containing protein [Candidatus Azobacteroides sp.]